MDYRNSGAANTAMRKLAVSLADSWDLRVILSVFYTIVEVFRSSQEEDSDEFKKIQEEFRVEIGKKDLSKLDQNWNWSFNCFP